MALFGIDVSSHQSNYTPTSNVDFLFVKATEGRTYVNPAHDEQIAKGRARNLVVGHYHWLHPGNAKAQASYFVRYAKPRKGDVLICDWEQAGCTNADKNAFMAEVKRLCPDNRVILYCNASWWNGSDKRAGDGLWVAHYTSASKPGVGDTNWLFWQYTDDPIDKNRTSFTTMSALRAWANKDAPVVEAPTDKGTVTADGVAVDMSEVVARNKERIPYRGGLACSCLTQVIPVVEARMKAAGIIKYSVDFFQLSYRGDVAASAGTHAGGGAVDVAQCSEAAARIWRECGFAFWTRTPAQGFILHGHGILMGCPHVSDGARDQIVDYKNNRNGLANNGRDDGPKVAPIDYQDAIKKYTRTSTTVQPTTEEEDFLDMAKQQKTKVRTDDQIVKPTTTKYQLLKLENSGDVTWGWGGGKYELDLRVIFSGIDSDSELMVRVVYVDTDKKTGKVVGKPRAQLVTGLPGGAGNSFRSYHWRGHVAEPKEGLTRRLRIEVGNFSDKDIRITRVDARSWKA